jgi:hypothetical protein
VVPPTWANQVEMMRWAAAEHDAFRINDGRFLAPIPGSPDKEGTLTRPATHLGNLTLQAVAKRAAPAITDADRTAVRDELHARGTALIVMRENEPHGAEVRATTDALVGPGRLVQGLWVWDVRSLSTIR